MSDNGFKVFCVVCVTLVLLATGSLFMLSYQRNQIDRIKLEKCAQHNEEVLKLIKEGKTQVTVYSVNKC